MGVQLIERDAWSTQAWKNGGGVTHEIAREEDARGLLWRLSVAEVDKDGPFSPFDGLDRVIALVEGAGFALTFTDGRRHQIASAREPFAFAGEQAPHCTLLAGPVLDWNLMSRRNDLRARVETVEAAGAHELRSADVQLVFCAMGQATLEADGTRVALARHATVVLRNTPAVLTLSPRSLALAAQLTRVTA